MKVSFKETPNRPFKTVQRFNDKVTLVTLQGKLLGNKELALLPSKICKWLCYHSMVDNACIFGINGIHIKATGKTIKSKNDIDNPVLAERIAEARAKIKIYKFMYTLCSKLYKHFCMLCMGFDDLKLAYWRVDSIYGDMKKYYKLLEKEKEHLQELIEKS